MTASSNLYRRPSGVYAARLVVPAKLRNLLGRREVHRSTGVRSLPVAKTVGAALLAHWRQPDLEYSDCLRVLTHGGEPKPFLDAMQKIEKSRALHELLFPEAAQGASES